jgi:hypothetical protein
MNCKQTATAVVDTTAFATRIHLSRPFAVTLFDKSLLWY